MRCYLRFRLISSLIFNLRSSCILIREVQMIIFARYVKAENEDYLFFLRLETIEFHKIFESKGFFL